MMNIHDQEANLDCANKEDVMETAKNMLVKGYSVAEVIGVTNLPPEEVIALNKV